MAATRLPSILEPIQRVVRQIVHGFHPEKVILSGSHAHGERGRTATQTYW